MQLYILTKTIPNIFAFAYINLKFYKIIFLLTIIIIVIVTYIIVPITFFFIRVRSSNTIVHMHIIIKCFIKQMACYL